jgi:hypothetical protein
MQSGAQYVYITVHPFGVCRRGGGGVEFDIVRCSVPAKAYYNPLPISPNDVIKTAGVP